MWLADDDEISPGFIEGLVNTLNQHPDAVTAVPYWKVIFSPESGRIMPMNQYRNNYWFFRVLKFVWKGSVDDSLVYSLHRSDLLKKANPVDHWWPNKGSATNSQDTHLFDLVILGKIIGTPQKDVVWTSHFYTEKSYAIPKNSAKERLKYIILFINIHAVYAFKVYKRCGIFYVLPVVATSCFRLIKPILRHTFSFFRKNFQKLFL
jgi:hypothetical protein